MAHLSMHFIVPAVVVALFFRKNWEAAYFIMVATMLVDLDHLMTNPVYDPMRCSIGFHPLHGWLPIAFYIVICFIPRLRYVGIGLVIHMGLDWMDCQLPGTLLLG